MQVRPTAEAWALALPAVLVLAALAIDLATHLGFVNGLLYALPIAAFLWTGGPRKALVPAGVIATALILFGLLWSPGAFWIEAGERAFAIALVWVLVLLVRGHLEREDDARASAERLHSALESSGVGTFDFDPLTGRQTFSDTAKRLWGFEADEEPEASKVLARVHPDDRYIAARVMDSLRPGAIGSYAVEHRIVLPDGTVRWISTRGRTRFEGEGTARRAVRSVGTMVDVTERRRAEQAARAADERLRQMLIAARVGTWDWDVRANRIVSWRDRSEEGAPYERAMSFEEFLARIEPDCRAQVEHALERALRHDEPYEVEYCIRRPDGGRYWLLSKGRVTRDAEGRPLRVTGIGIDITPRKSIEAELRDRERRMTIALEAASTGTWRTHLATRTVMQDANLNRIFGLPAQDALVPLDEFLARVHPEDLESIRAATRAAIAGEANYSVEFRYLRRDGSTLWLHAEGRIERDHLARPEYVTGAATDITERKGADAKQKLLLRELNHRVKNSLAVVQSIAMQTRRAASGSLERFYDAFSSRLQALARTHDLLIREGWHGASLEDVVRETLAPHLEAPRTAQRLSIAGPRVRLDSNVAVSLSMALHELGTNAAKYGALSNESGRITLSWRALGAGDADGDGGGEATGLQIDWIEHGGPPVEPSAHEGFGTRLLQGLARELDGEAELRLEPAGLEAHLRFPLSEKAALLLEPPPARTQSNP